MHIDINLVIFILAAIFSLIVKLTRKKEDASESMPDKQESPLDKIPQELRKMFLGEEAAPEKPRPQSTPVFAERSTMVNAEKYEGDASTRPNSGRNYRVPVAKPAKPAASLPEDCPRRSTQPTIVIKSARKPQPLGVPTTKSALSSTKTSRAQEPAKIDQIAISLSQKALAKASQKTKPAKPDQPATKQPAPSLVPHGIDDFRRAVILQEIIGPPVSMR